MRSVVVFVFLASVVIHVSLAKDDRVTLESGAVYQIINKLDNGTLTVDAHSMENVPVLSRTFSTSSGQKWRLHKAFLGQSFKLSPTSNEKAILDLDKKTLSIWGRISAAGNQKYWNLNNMGEGIVQIQNWQKNNLCLTTLGLDKEVSIADCENSPAQQWQFLLL